MAEKIRILVVEPGIEPREVVMEYTLENLQDVVSGTIQAIYPWKDDHVALICNDDGIALGLEFSRYVFEREYGPIWGTFFICGLGKENFVSLTDEQVKKYTERFKEPEQMFTANGRPIILRGGKAMGK